MLCLSAFSIHSYPGIIIDSYREKGSITFWNVVRKLPLQENQIVCWKFCHVLHKLLREGHPRAIADAYPYRRMILDLGRLWGLLKDGYGKLIQNYCTLVVTKIDFHARVCIRFYYAFDALHKFVVLVFRVCFFFSSHYLNSLTPKSCSYSSIVFLSSLISLFYLLTSIIRSFLVQNVRFPGSLQVTDEELDEIGERDVNVL